MEKKKSGWLQKAFRTAILGTAMIASVAGMTTPAYAQDGAPQGVTVTQTVTQDQNVKPWANDPVYIETIRLAQEQSQIRLDLLHQRYQQARANLIDGTVRAGNAQYNQMKRMGRDGLNFGEIAQTVTGANRIATRQNTLAQTYDLQERNAENLERQRMNTYIQRVDAQYARQPHYAAILKQQAAARAQQSVSGTQIVTASPTHR